MAADYSWDISAEKYIDMYSNITGIPRPQKKPVAPPKAKKSEFDKVIREDFEASEKMIADKAKPREVVKVENPFGGKPEKKASPKNKTSKTKAKPTKK